MKNKPPLNSIQPLQDAIQEVEADLGTKGRVLIRYSGTQPICRVMVEGPTEELTTKLAESLAQTVKDTIG